MKYFYCTQVNLKSICTLSEYFSSENFYFTTFQSIKVFFIISFFLPLILKNTKNVVGYFLELK